MNTTRKLKWLLVGFCAATLTLGLGGCKKKKGGDSGGGGDMGGEMSGGGGGGDIWSCDLIKEQKKCIEGKGDKSKKAIIRTCTKVYKGTIGKKPCPSANESHRCTTKMAGIETTDVKYDKAHASTDEKACKAMGGTFAKK